MSTIFDPLDFYPGVLERKPGFVDLHVPMGTRPEASGAILWGSWHFNHLYGPRSNSQMGGATVAADDNQRWPMLAAVVKPDGGGVRNPLGASTSLRYGRRSRSIAQGVYRDQLRFVFDLADFPTINGGDKVLPADDQMLYVTLNQTRFSLPISGVGFRQSVALGAVDNGDIITGPILPIPPAGWWTISEPTLILAGEAPSIGGGTVAFGAAGTFPNPSLDIQWPNPLHFVLPRPTTSFTVSNTEGVGGANLRVSHGLGAQIYELAPGTGRTVFGAVKEFCLMSAAAGATCAFTIEANVNLGGAVGGV